ncbi:MAG: hypothetical protein Q4F66_00770 [Clostridium sp.]|nr:hypothetical protein [Clostridium sp.]
MGKILGSWSGMRRYLEEEMIAESLKKRIRYSCTTFVGMDGCGIFEIIVDKKTIKQFSIETVASDVYSGSKPVDMEEYWSVYWTEKRETSIEDRHEFDDVEFAEALENYRNSSIQDSINSENPLVRMFAVMDRRIGKRTLERIKDEILKQPEWLQYFYKLRIEAENIIQQ